MAVDSDSYGTVVKVENMVGDLVDGRKFNTTSFPKLSEVESLIDDVADELNAMLKAHGYTVPVVEANDPYAYGMLHIANSAGASALVISMLPTESWAEPGNVPVALTRRAFYERRVDKIMKLIENGKFPADRAITTGRHAYAGSRTDRELGETKKPIFKRSTTDFPGSRTLQE